MSSPKTSSAAILRLMSDLKQIRHNPPEGVSASPVSDENMFVWEATIFGPEETPWEAKWMGLYGNHPLCPKHEAITLLLLGNCLVTPLYQHYCQNITHHVKVCRENPFLVLRMNLVNPTTISTDSINTLGGIYSLRLSFSEQYPSKPPKVRFISDMYHPNVYADGTLCLDIIQDNWSPIYSVSSILTSIQSLLSDPNPASPANPDAGQCYLNDREKYNKLVRRCASRTLE